MELIDKLKLREAFSRASRMYEVKAALQKEIAEELFEKVNRDVKNAQTILDIGMGTGFLTGKLKEAFSNAEIAGLDFAYGMASYVKERSHDIKVIQADAEALPFKDELFDLIVSNLAYQWVPRLEIAFRDTHRILTNKGSFFFTCFGSETLKELRASFKYVEPFFKEDLRIPNYRSIMRTLRRCGFRRVE
ncbi:methyltransferase domain-containing protein, partial [Candidatus Omnitrophota bacterium]